MGDTSQGRAQEWTSLQRAYIELRTQLQLSDDPRTQVELLRQLSAYRSRIAQLDEAIEKGTPLKGVPIPLSDLRSNDPRPDPTANSELASLGVAGRELRWPPARASAPPARLELVHPEHGPGTPDSVTPGGIDEPDRAEEAEGERAEEPAPASVVQDPLPATASVPAPVGSEPLTLRFVVEGPPGAGTSTVIRHLAEQFHAVTVESPLIEGSIVVNWFDFLSGSFEGQPIRFEVCSLQGTAERKIRRHLRSLADAVILVVDSTPEGLGAAAPYLEELQHDRSRRDRLDAPDLSVFAHKEDLTDALTASQVRVGLALPPSTTIMSTTRERAGFRQGFGLATSSAVRRTQARDRDERQRTIARTGDAFVAALTERIFGPPAAGGSASAPANPLPTVNPQPTVNRWQGAAPIVDSSEPEVGAAEVVETEKAEPEKVEAEKTGAGAAEVRWPGVEKEPRRQDPPPDRQPTGPERRPAAVRPPNGLSWMDVAHPATVDLPLGTAAAEQGVLDLRGIAEEEAEVSAAPSKADAVAAARPGHAPTDDDDAGGRTLAGNDDTVVVSRKALADRPPSSSPSRASRSVPAEITRFGHTAVNGWGLTDHRPSGGLGAGYTNGISSGSGRGTTNGGHAPDGSPATRGAAATDRATGDDAPPPFIAGRQIRRPERSTPPSVLHRPGPRPSTGPARLPGSQGTPVGDGGSLFGDRTRHGQRDRPATVDPWPPPPSAADRVWPDPELLGPAARAALEHGPAAIPPARSRTSSTTRRSALRRLIDALRG